MSGTYEWGRRQKWGGWRSQTPGYSIVCGGGIHLMDLMMSVKRGQEPRNIAARGIHGEIISAVFWIGSTLCSLTVDFTAANAAHHVEMSWSEATGHQVAWFDEPNDFRAPISDFLSNVVAHQAGNGLEALAANRACLAIERAVQ